MDSFISSDVVPLISAITALVAVLIGPMWAFRLARKQTVSPMRLAWVASLRIAVVEFLEIAEACRVRLRKGERISDDEKLEIIRALNRQQYLIQLMLNVDEPDHHELLASVHSVLNCIGQMSGDTDPTSISEDMERQRDALLRSAGKVLKQTWDLIKRMKG